MEYSAKLSASQRRDKPAGGIIYDNQTAHSHWKGKRQQEFGALLRRWNQATGKTISGGALLQHLSALCDAQHRRELGTPVGSPDNLVWEFTVTPAPGMGEVRVWLGLYGNGVPNLRAAPALNTPKAREALLKEMRTSAKQSAGQRRDKPAGDIASDEQT